MTPQQIAKGLTKAQRADIREGRCESEIAKCVCDSTGLPLFRLNGLVKPGGLMLTPLGLAVRAILEQEPQP